MKFALICFLCLFNAILCSIYTACSKEGQIAFTFDQGPSYYTGNLLNTLKKHSIKASFHVTTDYLDNPVIMAYIRNAARDGHLIGLFIKHNNFTAADILSHLDHQNNKLQKQVGFKLTFLRFPNPGPSKEVLEKVSNAGYFVTSYNLDSQDYMYGNSTGDEIFQVIKSNLDLIVPPAKGSFICVQRDILEPSVKQSDMIIEYAKKKGYTAVRLDECIGKQQLTPGGGGGIGDSLPSDPTGILDEPSKPQKGHSSQVDLCLFYQLSIWLISIFLFQ